MINTRIGAVQRAHLVRRPFRRAALVAPILAMSSYSAWADCPNVPNGSVYAYACSQANDGNGVAIQISGGAGTVSTSGLAGIDTAPLGGSNASRAFLNGQFGITGTNGQVSTTDSVNFSNAYGSGSATATAGMGDKYNATLNTIPFANGNPAVSQQRLNTNVVIPSLHASASGSSFGSSGGGPTVPSSGEDFFSDILSITQAQLNAFNQEFGGNHSTLFVSFSYAVSGTVNASPDTVSSPSVGTAGASFGVT